VLLLEDLYCKSVSALRVDMELTDWFELTVSVHKGCNLSLYLFNLILEVMTQEALKDIDFGVHGCGEPVNNLRFTDDIDLITESHKQLQELTNKVSESSKRFGLKINAEKIEVMAVGQQSRHKYKAGKQKTGTSRRIYIHGGP